MKPIKIGIDGNEANVLYRVGSNTYAYEILKALHNEPGKATYTVYLKDAPAADMPLENKHWRYRVIKPGKLWTQWRLPLDLYLRKQIDVFFSPSHYAPRYSPVPTVVTIFDLSFYKFPNLFLKYERGLAQLKNWTKYSVEQSSHVITISQNSKQDIEEIYSIKPEHISVAYPGLDRTFFKPASKDKQEKVKAKYNTGDKFILYVGTIQPRKNLIRLLKAFEKLPSKHRQVNLVLAGQKGWLYEDFVNHLKHSPKKQNVILTGFVDQEDLPALYSAASVTTLVGLYEGFGIPPAESLSCGTIPVVSNTSSLPEVVGESGLTVDPYSVTQIRHALHSVLIMPEGKKRKRLKIADDHLVRFNWQQSAKIIREVLYDVAIQR